MNVEPWCHGEEVKGARAGHAAIGVAPIYKRPLSFVNFLIPALRLSALRSLFTSPALAIQHRLPSRPDLTPCPTLPYTSPPCPSPTKLSSPTPLWACTSAGTATGVGALRAAPTPCTTTSLPWTRRHPPSRPRIVTYLPLPNLRNLSSRLLISIDMVASLIVATRILSTLWTTSSPCSTVRRSSSPPFR